MQQTLHQQLHWHQESRTLKWQLNKQYNHLS